MIPSPAEQILASHTAGRISKGAAAPRLARTAVVLKEGRIRKTKLADKKVKKAAAKVVEETVEKVEE